MPIFFVPRRFVESSKLQQYLSLHYPDDYDKTEYNLYTVLSSLKDILGRQRMFDPQNPSLILCTPDLEEVFDVKAFHVSELRHLVCQQLVTVFTPPVVDPPALPPPPPMSQAPFLPDTLFTVSPQLATLFETMPGVAPGQTIYPYKETTRLLSQYIQLHKDRLFDRRNIKVCLVENDLLGKVFGVKAFHRTQVTSLLRNQLTLLCDDEEDELDDEEEEEGEYDVVEEDIKEVRKSDASDTAEEDLYVVQPVEGDGKESGLASEEDGEVEGGENALVKIQECRECHAMAPLIVCCRSCWIKRKSLVADPPRKKRKRKETKHVSDEEPSKRPRLEELCILCCDRPRNAIFIHGNLSHQACCYPCAKITFNTFHRCPVCNQKIEKIVKNVLV